ncbi:MAG: tRNA pseudouridine(38-40) synthase TruA [Alphaproteobacteria bacterium]|nr:tRNA pseudouridine(38-40) synthase TruA [Alphaproteobacteria bacterium]
MSRWRITVEYDGGPFVGWQRQENGPSVQAALEEAIAAFCGEEVQVTGAGRTDSGVHALAQVAHFDLARATDADTVRDALNFHLKPRPVAVLAAAEAADDFHARFSAVGRDYLYRIVNRRAPLALDAGRAWQVSVPLDEAAMGTAAGVLVGRHDFTSFRAAQCQAESPVKTLDAVTVARQGETIEIRARARSFLHNQVRIIVGTLRQVGEGKWSAGDVAEALAARDRAAAGPTAPACGLYLAAVRY